MAATFLLLIAGLLAAFALLWRTTARWRGLPFTRQPSLLSAAEQRFYRVLLQAVPPDLVVCVKVRLLDVVAVPDHAWRTYGAKGSGMHLDFVIVTAAALEPRLAVELDDRSHALPAARQRDRFKEAALAAAGMPLLRVLAASRYNATELRASIQEALPDARATGRNSR
jgi:hypothetical protein